MHSLRIVKKVLSEVSAHLEGAEEFLKKNMKQIYATEKISADELIYFLLIFCQSWKHGVSFEMICC